MNATQKENHEACQQSERNKITSMLELASQSHEWCCTVPAFVAGFHTCTGLFICAQCAHRYSVRDTLPRGFVPIYDDQTDKRDCEFCEENDQALASEGLPAAPCSLPNDPKTLNAENE